MCPGLLEAQELSQNQKLLTGHLAVPMALKGKKYLAKHGKQSRHEKYALGVRIYAWETELNVPDFLLSARNL